MEGRVQPLKRRKRGLLFQSFVVAAREMSHRDSRTTLMWSLLLTVVFTLLVSVGAFYLLDSAAMEVRSPEWLGEWANSWLQGLTWLLGGGLTLVTAILGFRFAANVFLGFFLDRALRKLVERRPDLGPLHEGESSSRSLARSVTFLLKSVAVHLLCIPLYLLSFFFPPLTLLLFLVIDGRLLARELFEQVSPQLIAEEEQKKRWKGGGVGWSVWGGAVSLMMAVPFLNLAVPLFATYAMVYVLRGPGREG